ncbi:DUF2478 domain-containing protein [Roseibaca sp. V10]|uniref:DUF2478 domain-containing protein n=1 Tax=Roseinatronobacter domitianus TaxID=2940293 RepID=A0ABT0LZZ2_9RHOB|nr:DUF2478 domain-containing protein [Roseibaca domitiana]MCL1628187.1 DUF2478 domain-containing protein [Roseibaca domitiana]
MFAYFIAEGRGAGDRVLLDLAQTLMARGMRLCGAVQDNIENDPSRRCHMDLQLLGSDRIVRISQDRGRHATGCRLDSHGLAEAVFLVESALEHGRPDLLIVNKFGKQECEGAGFRQAIGQALAAEIPVLTGCAPGHRAGLLAFSDGLATQVPPTPQALLDWCLATCANKAPLAEREA